MDDHASQVEAIRTFNRFYTRIIGLLDEGMHHSQYTLAEARLVHEIGKRISVTRSELTHDLGMDRAHLHRLMLRLLDHGLIATGPGRSGTTALTRDGDRVFSELNTASDGAAGALLKHLDPLGRRDLVASMARIETLLTPEKPVGTLILRPPHIGDIGWLIHRQGLLYHLEQGWNGEFETLIAKIYAAYQEAPSTPPKSLWVAEQDGQVAGSVFIIPAEGEDNTAQLRMLYVEPSARGQGLGKRLVEEAVRFSRASGYARIMLWTQDCLVSARRIYQSAGFVLVEEEKHHSFGTDLNGQYWALKL